ncbi:hypothetical protein [Actinospica robiniae]|uniref:hypothetical protein n=1 Tax=Actinospica robiniae TaxID=304901 RepID=UPI0003FB49DA|nr:hypothetical protein [Actinospica robiniae]
MKAQAFSTSAQVPVSRAEADRVAHELFAEAAEAAEEPRQVSIQDFGEFFTIVVFKPVTDLSEPDTLLSVDLGRSVSVLDKSSGRISFWPSLAEEDIAAQFRECLNADEIEDAEWPT